MFDLAPGRPAFDFRATTVSQFVECASDAAFAIDDQRRVLGWNRAAEQLLGYAADEVIGRHCAEVLKAVLPGGEPLCMPGCELFRCFRNCDPRSVTSCRVRRKDGAWLTVGYSSLVMPGQSEATAGGTVVAVVFLRETESSQARAALPGTLQVFALGKFGLAINGTGLAVDRWKRRQAVTLFKYLVTRLDRPVHRERILECLWPNVDEERGWGRLKVTLYYLRTQLRAAGVREDAVQTVGDAYLLKGNEIWVDADQFEKLVAEGRALQTMGRIDDALRCYGQAQGLYRGDYFEQDIFADWCAEDRERFGEIYLEMMARKAQCHALRGEFAEAVEVCRKALVRDPCRESFHRDLMEHLVRLGHPDRAIAQFRHCQAVLASELGVEPMPETQRLYRQILAPENTRACGANGVASLRDGAHRAGTTDAPIKLGA